MKPLFVISCPIDTYSGYGARARDLVKEFLNHQSDIVLSIVSKPQGFWEKEGFNTDKVENQPYSTNITELAEKEPGKPSKKK